MFILEIRTKKSGLVMYRGHPELFLDPRFRGSNLQLQTDQLRAVIEPPRTKRDWRRYWWIKPILGEMGLALEIGATS